MYFKVHKIFKFDFHRGIIQMMLTLQSNVYKMELGDVRLTSTTLKNAKKFFP